MIEGFTCEHCLNQCQEAWRETPCRDFREDWQRIIQDKDQRIAKMGKAEYRRICRQARKAASGKI